MTYTTKCRVCGIEVKCLEGHKIDEFEQDKEFNDYFYSCSTCISNGDASALGSIVHWCSNPITNGSLDKVTEKDITKIFLEMK